MSILSTAQCYGLTYTSYVFTTPAKCNFSGIENVKIHQNKSSERYGFLNSAQEASGLLFPVYSSVV